MEHLTFEFTGYGRVHRPESAWNDWFGVLPAPTFKENELRKFLKDLKDALVVLAIFVAVVCVVAGAFWLDKVRFVF